MQERRSHVHCPVSTVPCRTGVLSIKGRHPMAADSARGDIPRTLVRELHGGRRPRMHYVIKSIVIPCTELSRSAAISNQPGTLGNMNRCQEWGAPRVPILTVRGGDQDPTSVATWKTGDRNPCPIWSEQQLQEIDQGSRKRVRL